MPKNALQYFESYTIVKLDSIFYYIKNEPLFM